MMALPGDNPIINKEDLYLRLNCRKMVPQIEDAWNAQWYFKGS